MSSRFAPKEYDSERSKLLLRYIERNKFRKLDKFLTLHSGTVDRVVARRRRQVGLHVAARLGHSDCVEQLLRHGARVDIQDRKKCFPIHYAAKYCLKNFSLSLMEELVQPLWLRSKHILNERNAKGTAPSRLLDALLALRSVELAKEECDSSSSGGEDRDQSEVAWRDKLLAADDEDAFDLYGAALNADEKIPDQETYDQWADRLYAEYKKRFRSIHQQDNNPGEAKQDAPAPEKVKPSLKLRKTPKRKAYKDFVDKILCADNEDVLRVKMFPFTSSTSPETIVSEILEELNSDQMDTAGAKKRFLREELRRWHPDKFHQFYHRRFAPEDADEIMKIATHVSQSLIKL